MHWRLHVIQQGQQLLLSSQTLRELGYWSPMIQLQLIEYSTECSIAVAVQGLGKRIHLLGI